MNNSQKLVIDPKQVIKGFCYSYCLALVEKLVELKTSRRLWILPESTSRSRTYGKGQAP